MPCYPILEVANAVCVVVVHLLTHLGDAVGALVVAATSSNTASSVVKCWLLEDSAYDDQVLAVLLGQVHYTFTLDFHFSSITLPIKMPSCKHYKKDAT